MTEASPTTEHAPLWWQEHAWNSPTFGLLNLQRRDHGVVALQNMLLLCTEGAPAVSPPASALPSILDFLRAANLNSQETFFESWKRLHAIESEPENRENNSLARAYLLHVAPWTVEEADEILTAFAAESPADGIFVGNRPFPDKRIIANSYALPPIHFLAMQAFLTNPHLLGLRSSNGEPWFEVEVIDPLLDEIGKALVASDRESLSEFLRAVIDNPAVSFEQVEEVAVVAKLAIQSDEYRVERESFLEHLELVLSGANRSTIFEHRLAAGQRFSTERARLLARSRDQKNQAPKLFQFLMADPNSEQVGREIVRDIIMDKSKWQSSMYALPLMGAVLHGIYEENGFPLEGVPLEWVMEVLS